MSRCLCRRGKDASAPANPVDAFVALEREHAVKVCRREACLSLVMSTDPISYLIMS